MSKHDGFRAPEKICQGVEVANISMHGIWLLVNSGEYFLPFDDFPWFREASVGAIHNVSEPTPAHYYWPDLDVDLGLSTIRNPKKYPLRF